MISLDHHADGVILPVKALPGSRRNGIRGVHDGALKVSVTQVAEKGKANKAIVAFLADQLGLRKHQLELVAGETVSNKRLLVRGITAVDLQGRIEVLLQQI